MKVYKPVLLAAHTLPIIGMVLMSPILPQIAEEFPHVSDISIQMLVTLPAICSLVFGQISGWLSNFVNKKNLILTGLLLFFIGGFGAYFITEFWQLFLCRLLVGVGIGLFLPVNLSLFSDYYTGDERTSSIGLSQAVNYLGGVLGTLFAGLIAATNWRNVFFINLVVAGVFLIDLIWLPSQKNRAEAANRKFQILPTRVYIYAVFAFLQMMVFYSCVTNFSARIMEAGQSNSFYASIGIACLYFGCFATGTVLLKMMRIFKKWIAVAAVSAMLIGFIFLFCGSHLLMLYLGILLVGLGDGIIIPYLYAKTADASPIEYNGQAMATVNFGVSIGQFVAPLFFAAVKNIVGGTVPSAGFAGISITLAVVLGIMVLYNVFASARTKSAK